jgi:acyl dehydratase
MLPIPDLAALEQRLGQEIAVSDWIEITQERIDAFAASTEDRQWIHTDPIRAKQESRFGTTIAHGFLTLSLVSRMARTAMSFPGTRMAVNYGVNKVRFVSAVPVDSRIRGRFSAISVQKISDGGVQIIWSATVEREGGEKPACTAEWIVRYYY